MANRNNNCPNNKYFQNNGKANSNNQKAPPGFKYVPAKVLVPIPPSEQKKTVVTKTTYVTNYVYNGTAGPSAQAPRPRPPMHVQPKPPTVFTTIRPIKPMCKPHPQPNQKLAHGVSWELVTPESAMRLADRAVVGGHEGWDGSPLWVIRSRQGRDVVPGKLAAKHKAAYVPFAGKEMPVQNIEVLCAAPGRTRWASSSNGSIPFGAIPGGLTASGETLYIGRAKHNNSVTPGKVHPSHGTCYISFSGQEIAVKTYEVLCTA